MVNYAGIEDKHAEESSSKICLQSIPYDGTSTWGKGADEGFKSFLEASANMELFDIETDFEVYKKGIYMPNEWSGFNSPEQMYQSVYAGTQEILRSEKFPTFFGGEHSISIGIIKAFYEKFENLTVLQLDAHADLRPSYEGSEFNHACAVFNASQNCNLVQVGIRSMDISEKKYMKRENVFFDHDIRKNDEWMVNALEKTSEKVYITLDLDVFDPSIMPATGTPEPNGLLWQETLTFLKMVFEHRNVVGFDIVELAPIKGFSAPQFLAAKLYYKMLSYKFK